jgi:hypothetical protein
VVNDIIKENKMLRELKINKKQYLDEITISFRTRLKMGIEEGEMFLDDLEDLLEAYNLKANIGE